MSGETLPAATGQGSGKIFFNDKAPRGVKLLLYTEGFICIPGIWQDGTGIIGWGYMPDVDKEERAQCLLNPHAGFRKQKLQPKETQMDNQNHGMFHVRSLPGHEAVKMLPEESTGLVQSDDASVKETIGVVPVMVQTKEEFLASFKKVESSQIDSLAWKDSKLYVNFKNGAIYEYLNVSYELYQEVLVADSVGKAFNAKIKNNASQFPFKKV